MFHPLRFSTVVLFLSTVLAAESGSHTLAVNPTTNNAHATTENPPPTSGETTASSLSLRCGTITRQAPPAGPQGTDVVSIITSAASSACSAIAAIGPQSIADVTFQGYALFAGFETNQGPLNTELCNNALIEIANQCVLQKNGYDGQYFSSGQLFNLTNLLSRGNPIIYGTKAPQVIETIPLTVPCAPTFPGSTQICPTIPLGPTITPTSNFVGWVSGTGTPTAGTKTTGKKETQSGTISNLATSAGVSTNSKASGYSQSSATGSEQGGNPGNTGAGVSTTRSGSQRSDTGSQATATGSKTGPMGSVTGLSIRTQGDITSRHPAVTQASSVESGPGGSGPETNTQPDNPLVTGTNPLVPASSGGGFPVGGGGGITVGGFTTIASNPVPIAATSGTPAVLAAIPLATELGSNFLAAAALAASLAGLAENAVSDAAVRGLEGGLFSTFTAASTLVEQIEMTDFSTLDTASAKVLRDAVDPLDNLLNLARDWLTDLATMLAKKTAKHPTLALIAAAMAADQAGPKLLAKTIAAIKNLKPNGPDDPDDPEPTLTVPTAQSTFPSSTQSTASSTATGSTSYLLMTKGGTPPVEFKSLINSLPDRGQGRQIVFAKVSFQAYLTNLTAAQAQSARSQSIVAVVIPNDLTDSQPDGDQSAVVPRPARHEKVRRAQTTTQPNSPDHLKLISQSQPDNIGVNGGSPKYPPPMADYTYDTDAGTGTRIYVIDNGFYESTTDVQIEESYVVDAVTMGETEGGPMTLQEAPGREHGTCVASVAGGRTYGVAKQTKIIPIKHKDSRAWAQPAAITEAWAWAINEAQGTDDRSVINYSYGREANSPQAQAYWDPFWNTILNDAWGANIVTVVAAGNDGLAGGRIENFVPVRLGRPNNALITVGGTYNNGYLWEETRPIAGGAGSIDIYAQADQIHCASSTDPNGFVVKDGTSFAAPAIAGLAAYFLSLPALRAQLTTPQAVKNYIVQQGYERRPTVLDDASPIAINRVNYAVPAHLVVAYNGARDNCNVNPHVSTPKGKRGLNARDAVVCSRPVSPASSIVPATSGGVNPNGPIGGATITATTAAPYCTATAGAAEMGPCQFCQGYSPGSGNVCQFIPGDCYFTVPLGNTVPSSTCGVDSLPPQTSAPPPPPAQTCIWDE